MLIPSAEKRSKLLKKHHFFALMGENVHFQPRKLPSDPKFIKLHNNVHIASDVTFVTHDITYKMFNYMSSNTPKLPPHVGCIEILDNVFIGTGAIIMPNVRIGPNAIVAAGAVVTKDVLENSIVAGIPAKNIGSFTDFYNKRVAEHPNSPNSIEENREKLAATEWEKFYSTRSK